MKKLGCLLMLLLPAMQAHAACLQSPTQTPLITSNYGLRFHPKYHIWRPHKGMDMRAGMYTPVLAANGGKVTYTGYMGGGGNAVIIMGNDGVQTRYMHLSKPQVAMSSTVSPGQQIALSGNTGEASVAAHLHFETRTNSGTMLVDPRSLLCSAFPEKPGAGPDKVLAGLADGGGIPSGGGVAGSGGGAVSETPFNGYDGMGEEEILRAEAEKRFMNPDWYAEMSAASPEAIQKEMALIQALRGWMTLLRADSQARVEAMMAAGGAQVFKQSLAAQRATAASAAARKSAK